MVSFSPYVDQYPYFRVSSLSLWVLTYGFERQVLDGYRGLDSVLTHLNQAPVLSPGLSGMYLCSGDVQPSISHAVATSIRQDLGSSCLPVGDTLDSILDRPVCS